MFAPLTLGYLGFGLIPSIGWTETLVIFGVILFIFGPSKLPEIAEAMGKSIRKFKSATREIKNDIESDDPGSRPKS